MTKVKEPNFFAFRKFDLGAYPSSDHEMIDKSITDLDAYLALFDGMKSNQLAGESSPIYFYHPTAAASIGKAIPWAKFFLILRDPANRAWSDYQMHVREGRERRAFLDAIEEDRETFRCYIGSYLEKSEYGRHLSRYLEHFSQDRFRIWLFDELQEDPERLVQEAIEFIGLDGPPPSVIHRQFNVRPSRQPELPREARRRLIELLRPDVELLESLLHRDLGQWLK